MSLCSFLKALGWTILFLNIHQDVLEFELLSLDEEQVICINELILFCLFVYFCFGKLPDVMSYKTFKFPW